MTSAQLISRLPLLSAVVLLYAVVEALRTIQLQRTGVRVQGTVVDIDVSNEGDTPIVGFKAQDGKDYRFRVSTVLGRENWALATVWPVVYSSSNPKRARVERFPQLWGTSIVFALGGISSLIVLLVLSRVFGTI
jgi:hypothetical protein